MRSNSAQATEPSWKKLFTRKVFCLLRWKSLKKKESVIFNIDICYNYKMFFTQRFVKDIFLSALFMLFIYFVINNPITHPTPKQTHGKWSIQLMQQPLVFGIAGHNYLVLRNDSAKIVRELQGLATDSYTGAWKYIGVSSTDVLQVWEFNSPHFYLAEKKFSGITLAEGTRNDMNLQWGKAQQCAKVINDKKIPYPRFGVTVTGDTENSNSVAYTLALCMGLDPQHLGLITPGEGRNLLDD